MSFAFLDKQHEKEFRDASLWRVNDTFIQHPENKFHKECSPLIEATVEQWGCYQFDNAPLPRELEIFVARFVSMLGLSPSEDTSIADVCHSVMTRIEYDEPYFYLVDMLISMSHNEMTHTYRHRKTGDVLNPATLETFKIDRGWDFKPYHVVKNMMEHPGMRSFLEKNVIPPQFKSREEAMLSLLSKIAEVVWGRFGWLEDFVDQGMSSHEEGLAYDEGRRAGNSGGYTSPDVSGDRLLWLAGTLGTMTWFKSPNALPFLATYHIIYATLLDEMSDGRIGPMPGTGDEVIIDGVDVYTHREIEFIANRPPDACAQCGVPAHCTKFINATALVHRICSCGEEIDPLDTYSIHHRHYRQNCKEYRETRPERFGFVCQRCIFKIVNNLPQDIKCGRAACPATSCPHHMGQDARLRALTQQRTRQLTGATSS